MAKHADADAARRRPEPATSPRVTPDRADQPVRPAGNLNPVAVGVLQRSAGNRAVQGLFARRPVVQRCGPANPDCGCEPEAAPAVAVQRLTKVESEENLTSPRLAGEPRLERAFDNDPVMKPGETGDPVARVQETLVSAGFALPRSTRPTGKMDGVFGAETTAAVRAFQSREGLIPDGRLGRQTLGALDRQPGVAPPRPAVAPADADLESGGGEADNDDTSCPTPDEVTTAVAARPAQATQAAQLGFAVPAAATAASPAPVATSPIQAAVDRFKRGANAAGLADSENVSQVGQFFWGRRLREAVGQNVEALLTVDRRTLPFVTDARAVIDLIRQRDKAVPGRLNALDAQARSLTVSPAARQAMLALLAPPRRTAPALEIFLWNGLNASTSNSPPTIPAEHLSLRTARMLSLWDAQSCGFHANMIAQRMKQRGVTPAKDAVTFHFPLVSGSPFADQDRRVTGGQLLGEVVRQNGVSGAVSKMIQALDAGQYLHARVLSGIGYGQGLAAPPGLTVRNGRVLAPAPPEEHSLIVIGHSGNDTFVFNDPDATVSHSPEAGFGLLFFDSSRGSLNTAASAAGLTVDTGGKNIAGNKRYQVLTISTF